MHSKTLSGFIAFVAITLSGMAAAYEQDDMAAHDPRLEVDHLFIHIQRNEETRPVIGQGAIDDLNIFRYMTCHDGQGTCGIYAYFNNFYIEFLMVDDVEVAGANIPRAGADFALRNDWRNQDDISPFGIGIRDYTSDPASLPFETFTYDAEWMGGHFTLAVAENASQDNEPWAFTMPISVSTPPGPDLVRDGFAEFLDHPMGASDMTALELTVTGDAPLSPTMEALVEEGLLTVVRGDEPLARITFDNGAQGQTSDWRPTLPVIVEY